MPISKKKQQLSMRDADRKQPPKELVAVNLFDLDRIDEETRQGCLAGRLDPYATFDVDTGRKSDVGVRFKTDQDLLTCCCICDIIRGVQRKKGVKVLRVYVSTDHGKSWRTIGSSVLLSLISMNGMGETVTTVNPDIFHRPIDILEMRPEPKRIDRSKGR